MLLEENGLSGIIIFESGVITISMKKLDQIAVVMLTGLFFLAASASRSQSFTNSAVLSAQLDVTRSNLLVNFTMATNAGWVTLFSGNNLYDLATNAQPVDLAPVPTNSRGQFVVPLTGNAPAQFYKILIEQWPSRAKALIYTNGAYDLAAMRATYGDVILYSNSLADYFYGNITNPDTTTPVIFKPLTQVWLNNMGFYDTNGVQTNWNQGLLSGKYINVRAYSLDNTNDGLPYSLIPEFYNGSNNFIVYPVADPSYPPRLALMYSTEAQLYYQINDFRNRFFNDAFIDRLNLPAAIADNLKKHQCRPDLNYQNLGNLGILPPFWFSAEATVNTGNPPRAEYFPQYNNANIYSSSAILPSLQNGYATFVTNTISLGLAFDNGLAVGEYAGNMAEWILATNTGFASDLTFGPQGDIRPALNDTIAMWAIYRYTGDPEPYKQTLYALRAWNLRTAGGTGIPGDKGQCISNVMMFDEANTTANGVWPFQTSYAVQSVADGPGGGELAGMYMAAVFFDIANEQGLGVTNTDLLFWKTLSLITNGVPQYGDSSTYLSMRQYGALIQQAARLLWPNPTNPAVSLYENDLLGVMTSRGIPLNGVSDFRSNLPPAILVNSPQLQRTSGNQRGFGTDHPMLQPSVNSYGQFSGNFNGTTVTNAGVQYVAYQFYKHSKLGPCDYVTLTDGTFNPSTGATNGDGTYSINLTDRIPGNLVFLAPGNTIRWLWAGVRCPNEATGFYAEDVQPFGFMVTQATINGFSFTAAEYGETATNKTYVLTIVDPSTNSVGAGGVCLDIYRLRRKHQHRRRQCRAIYGA